MKLICIIEPSLNLVVQVARSLNLKIGVLSESTMLVVIRSLVSVSRPGLMNRMRASQSWLFKRRRENPPEQPARTCDVIANNCRSCTISSKTAHNHIAKKNKPRCPKLNYLLKYSLAIVGMTPQRMLGV